MAEAVVDILDLLEGTKLEQMVVLVVLVTLVQLLETQHQIVILIDKVILPVVLVEDLLMMDSAAVELVELVEAHLVTVVVVTVD